MISPRTLLATGQLSLLAVAAFLTASTVNVWVASTFRPRPSVSSDPSRAADAVPPRRPLSYYAPITERDIFNPRAPETGAQTPVGRLDAKLLGTAPAASLGSYAIIADGNGNTQKLYRLGDAVHGRVLSRVEWDTVVLRGPEGDQVLKIVQPASKPRAAAPSGVPGGIEQRGDNDFVVDRSEVDKAMSNLNELFTQIRAVPHFQDGKANGFRLFAIRQGSVFEKLGLKNGDIITRINGNELTDPARAMSLIQELRGEGRISVDVTRSRQPVALSYEIR
jgi:general secretion pathway protein C